MKIRKSTNILKIIPICFLLGCSDNAPTISVKLFPARLDEGNSSDPPSGWRRVDYAGGERAGKGIYLVAEKPIITEWNLKAFKATSQSNGKLVVTALLNAYGNDKISKHTGKVKDMRQHFALSIDGRWTDFSPILDEISDRITLFGFTPEEVTRLEDYLNTR